MMTKRFLLRRKGSALLQVIAAMFILSSGLTGALSLIIGAMRANDTQMHRLIATNLAQEGLEMMHNMRDTNWLVYSSNLRECWNYWPDVNENFILGDGADIECEPTSGQNLHPWNPYEGDTLPPEYANVSEIPCAVKDVKQFPKKFIIDFDPDNFLWNLVSEEKFGILSGVDYSSGFLLFKKTDVDGMTFYTHNQTTDVGETIENTPYSRSIGIYYIDAPGYDDTDYPNICGGYFPDGDTSADNRILIVSRVEWSNGGVAHNVTLSTIMTDYYDRHEWES